jgi:hypothetical protein
LCHGEPSWRRLVPTLAILRRLDRRQLIVVGLGG